MSVAYSTLLEQGPERIGHVQTLQWMTLLKTGPLVKLQHTSPCNPVTLCSDLRNDCVSYAYGGESQEGRGMAHQEECI
jgi:hypothetical protein